MSWPGPIHQVQWAYSPIRPDGAVARKQGSNQNVFLTSFGYIAWAHHPFFWPQVCSPYPNFKNWNLWKWVPEICALKKQQQQPRKLGLETMGSTRLKCEATNAVRSLTIIDNLESVLALLRTFPQYKRAEYKKRLRLPCRWGGRSWSPPAAKGIPCSKCWRGKMYHPQWTPDWIFLCPRARRQVKTSRNPIHFLQFNGLVVTSSPHYTVFLGQMWQSHLNQIILSQA